MTEIKGLTFDDGDISGIRMKAEENKKEGVGNFFSCRLFIV